MRRCLIDALYLRRVNLIYITGDIHGDYDISKLSRKNFPEQTQLTRKDYLIICGDFGLVWNNSNEEIYWRKWLENKPWTTLWIDGNHENFDLLEQYKEYSWKGGKIQKISDHVFHLCRGYVFDIDNVKIFAFGGAESHDKFYRKWGVSMWQQELPNRLEMERGIRSLEASGWETDIVITHTLPTSLQMKYFGNYDYKANELTDYFEEIGKRLKFRSWFSGHYHKSRQIDENYYMVYNDILRLTSSGAEIVRQTR